jgi:signal transduction histidine kinase
VLGTLWTATHTEVGRFTAADLHVLTMLSDFTAAALMLKTREQEALEAARRERTERERAELANRQKDEFLSTVSHELRTPLHAILSWSELLLDDLGEPDRLEAVTSIHRNALRQAELVEDLLDSASASNSTPPAETDVIELSGLIEDVLDHLASQARAKTIDIRTRLRTNILVDGQRGRLEQAVTNVLSNAIKFTEPGGSVRIELGVADREAEITVADSGIGIAADFLPFVFDRFRQADSSARRRHRGLGLGLALTRDFIHAHGGRVTVLSDGVGYGSRFTIALPLSQTGAITKSQRETTAPERPPLSGLRVLVVDDDADSRNSLAAVLTRAGAIVTAADSVRAALAAAIQAPPELVLTDIAIPVEDGYKMLECLRRDVDPKGSIPVIGITAYGSVATRERMNRAGFTDVIIKPVTARLLVDLVAGHVDRG